MNLLACCWVLCMQVLKEVSERALEAERAKPPVMNSDSESDSEEGEDPTPGAAGQQ